MHFINVQTRFFVIQPMFLLKQASTTGWPTLYNSKTPPLFLFFRVHCIDAHKQTLLYGAYEKILKYYKKYKKSEKNGISLAYFSYFA